MWIERPPKWVRKLLPGAIFRLPAPNGEKSRIFLTFDDGPIPEVSPWVLDCLDRYGVKATFFMVGQNVERYPYLLTEILKRGHSVGNHTLHHIRGLGISPEDYLKDAMACESLTQTNLFRPPHGLLTPSQWRILKNNFRIVMFDLVTRDYSERLSPKDVVGNVKRFARNGSIIVFHDSLKSWPRLKTALPESLEFLLAQEYEFALLKDFIK